MCIWDKIEICHLVHNIIVSLMYSKSYPLFRAKNYIAMLTESFLVYMTYFCFHFWMETAQTEPFLLAKMPLRVRSHARSHSELGFLMCAACGL